MKRELHSIQETILAKQNLLIEIFTDEYLNGFRCQYGAVQITTYYGYYMPLPSAHMRWTEILSNACKTTKCHILMLSSWLMLIQMIR